MGCFNRILTRKGQASVREVAERKIALSMIGAGMVGSLMAFYLGYLRESGLRYVGASVYMTMDLIALAFLACGGELNSNHALAFLTSVTVGTIILDIAARSEAPGADIWPVFVLLIDMALLCRVPRNYAILLVVMCVTWLFTGEMESAYRFGIFDLPGTPSPEVRREALEKQHTCASPPCEMDLTVAVLRTLLVCSIFILDFLATRWFADRAEKEQRAMQETINIVQQIATSLAEYDVDTVSDILRRNRNLPKDMHTALRTLERNLHTYRPYLPTALFEKTHGDKLSLTPATPPGLAAQDVTIVFTDIRSSSAIWEAAPEAMKKAIRTHNARIRSIVALCGGYEVKTVGDSFMVAFSNAMQGLGFSFAVHEGLLATDWPRGLLEVPVCSPELEPQGLKRMWNGLTVRIGVNSGPVTVEENVLTQRMDYFGHTVNVAARLESVCLPGAVALPVELCDALSDLEAVIGRPEHVALKGIMGEVEVCCAWPASLRARRQYPLDTKRDRQDPSYALHLPKRSGAQPSKRLETHVGTLGAVQLCVSEEAETDLSGVLNVAVATCVTRLERSGGVALALVGTLLMAGWNLTRETGAHSESAVRFASVIRRGMGCAGSVVQTVGLASGVVFHGDVGSQEQRFMTAVGEPVSLSWRLSFTAQDEDYFCLYVALSAGGGTGVLPAALRKQLRDTNLRVPGCPHPVYSLPEDEEEGSIRHWNIVTCDPDVMVF